MIAFGFLAEAQQARAARGTFGTRKAKLLRHHPDYRATGVAVPMVLSGDP